MSSDDEDYGFDDEEHASEEDDYDYQTYQSDDSELDDVAEVDYFTVLPMEEIQKRQNLDISSICSVSSISREIAISVLIHFNWNVSTAQDQWFADEERVRKAIGLLSGTDVAVPKPSLQNTVLCRICLEYLEVNQMCGPVCGHLFCNVCWISYISIAIDDGPSCLNLRCPDPSCSVAIGEDLLKLVSIQHQNKYKNYLLRSYVENSRELKWCPAPDCENAIEYVFGSKSFEVECNCLYNFCWNCLEEIHRPLDCDMVAKWTYKNSTEAKNTEWILSNSKPCPKCKKPIEKNLGCMHMTCSCRHEFCWLCLNPWDGHGGSFYTCNKYDKEKISGNIDEKEVRKQAAKEYVERYAHFYERWAANEESRKKSVLYLEGLKGAKLETISKVQKVPITEVDYITKAWEQIIECRRVMKWAYAYGYYIEEAGKKELFEFLQGYAELALERLHQCAEEEVMPYANAEDPSPDFDKLKEKLTRLTKVTSDHFDKFVRALENGLADVCS